MPYECKYQAYGDQTSICDGFSKSMYVISVNGHISVPKVVGSKH